MRRCSAASRSPGLKPQLAGEPAPRALIGLERVGLAAGPVQRQHQLTPEALLERMLAGEILELGDQLARRPGGQIGVDPAA